MKKKVFIASMFMALLSFSLVLISGLKVCAQTEAKPLIVNFSYASEKIRVGEIWKVYLSVTDPEGNMKKVLFRIEEPGAAPRYRPSFAYLKKEMEREFAGYFAFHTASSRNLSGVEITVSLTIVDGKGNERKTFIFPLEFDGQPTKPLPPEMEKELNRRIGIIDIDLNIPD